MSLSMRPLHKRKSLYYGCKVRNRAAICACNEPKFELARNLGEYRDSEPARARFWEDKCMRKNLTESSKSPASIAKSNKKWMGTCLYQEECKLLLINCGAVIRL